ncbi:hypothetical protein IGI04_038795 [Brassica rapa subsp. trilocularis]|uniref:Uncharacterized protein n=1 Tax=Brassica rapa subsp. trilocularis TaxID=1813537 RepID=A0ABQ7LNY5_BRACM|nr:hypothetical protein IGI04_038795 [Brassica rapa subsp. trilocularis]
MVEKARKVLCLYMSYVASVLKDKSSKLMTEARGLDDVVKPEPNRQTSPCAGQRHQTSRSAGEPSRDTARELEPSHALEEDDGNGESNANTGVALEWSGSLIHREACSVGSNLKPSAARKELRCPLVSTRERFKWCWFHVGATTQVDISCCGFSHVLAMFVSENNKDSQEISEKG